MTRPWNLVDPAPYDTVVEVRTYDGWQFRFNGKSGCGATKSPHRKIVRSGLKGADRDQR